MQCYWYAKGARLRVTARPFSFMVRRFNPFAPQVHTKYRIDETCGRMASTVKCGRARGWPRAVQLLLAF